MKLRLAVTGIGTLNPVGLTGLVALHSIRSGVSRLAMQPIPDRVSEWIAGGAIPKWIPVLRERRLLALAVDAVRAALVRAGIAVTDADCARHTALILGVAETLRPGYGLPPSGAALRRLFSDTELASFASIDVVPAGSCSAQAGLARAAELFASTSIRQCVIGAADTQLQLRTIRWHENNFRLKCSYITDGLMPAEAASFVVVEPEDAARARGAHIVARILAVNSTREPATVLSDAPNTAGGLASAVRATLDEGGASPGDVGMVWTDLNGESYRAREWAFTEVRLGFTTATELLHPADCYGDLGAATDATLLGLAAMCHGTGWSDGRPTLVVSGSEGGWRAATLLAPADGGGPFVQVMKQVPRVLSTSFTLPEPPRPLADFRESPDPPGAYFEWQLREEHRDELAALHYQWSALRGDPTVAWPRLLEPEQRMLNHLDAVVASGPSSMATVAAGLDSDEEGLCFAGAFLIGTLPTDEHFARITAALDHAAAPRRAGIAAGLLHAPDSQALRRWVMDTMRRGSPQAQAVAMTVAGRRRLDMRSHHPSMSRDSDAEVATSFAGACAQLRAVWATAALDALLAHDSPKVRGAALLALGSVAPDRAIRFARANIGANEMLDGAPALCLGMNGIVKDARVLLHHSEQHPTDRRTVEALGILGAGDAVPHLIALLAAEDEGAQGEAAAALGLISGLRVKERVAIRPGADDEDAADKTRDIERPTRSREFWASWWANHAARAETQVRWRRGDVFTLGSCIDEMEEPHAGVESRARAYRELAAQAAVDIPFDTHWFVPLQQSAIGAWRAWWAEHGGR